jgi:hypothetical protein
MTAAAAAAEELRLQREMTTAQRRAAACRTPYIGSLTVLCLYTHRCRFEL